MVSVAPVAVTPDEVRTGSGVAATWKTPTSVVEVQAPLEVYFPASAMVQPKLLGAVVSVVESVVDQFTSRCSVLFPVRTR